MLRVYVRQGLTFSDQTRHKFVDRFFLLFSKSYTLSALRTLPADSCIGIYRGVDILVFDTQLTFSAGIAHIGRTIRFVTGHRTISFAYGSTVEPLTELALMVTSAIGCSAKTCSGALPCPGAIFACMVGRLDMGSVCHNLM